MADKIVQLKDGNGNNLYPLSTSQYPNMGQVETDIRIGTFLGKPLWRKVQAFSNLNTGFFSKTFTNAIQNLSEIVNVSGCIRFNNDTSWGPVNYCVADNVTRYSLCINSVSSTTFAGVNGSSNSTTNSGYLIVDYTTTS